MNAIKPFTIVLPFSLYERLHKFCETEDFCKAHIVRTAIERELNRRERKARRLGLVRLGDVIPGVMRELSNKRQNLDG